MRRVYLFAAVIALTTGAVLWFSTRSARLQADPEPEVAGDETPALKTSQLPIGQVVLFSSGVGYFQREGSVDGNARIDLSFPVTDINDLLKSMVLRDLDGGHISTVSYDSNAPVERTLKSFAINLTGNPSFGASAESGPRREGRGGHRAKQRRRHHVRHRRRRRKEDRRRGQGNGQRGNAEPLVQRRHALR